MIALCTIASADDHLIEVPLQQAQVPFQVEAEGLKTVVLIAPDDVDRARAALAKFGTFEAGVRP